MEVVKRKREDVQHRGYHIRPNAERAGLYKIYLLGKGGSVPDRLKGDYSSYESAKRDIDAVKGRHVDG